jgi:hypothetical protein
MGGAITATQLSKEIREDYLRDKSDLEEHSSPRSPTFAADGPLSDCDDGPTPVPAPHNHACRYPSTLPSPDFDASEGERTLDLNATDNPRRTTLSPPPLSTDIGAIIPMPGSNVSTPSSHRRSSRSISRTPAHLRVTVTPTSRQKDNTGQYRGARGQYVSNPNKPGRRKRRCAEISLSGPGSDSEEENHLRKKRPRTTANTQQGQVEAISHTLATEIRREREATDKREEMRMEKMEAMLQRQITPMIQVGRDLTEVIRRFSGPSGTTVDRDV